MTMRKTLLLLGLVAAVAVLLPYSVPLLLALLTAILLEPVVQFWMRRLQLRRMVAVTVTFLLFLALFGLGSYWIGAKLIVQGVELAQRLPAVSSRLFELLESYIWRWESFYASLPAETVATVEKMLGGLKNSAVSGASGIAKWMVGVLAAVPKLLLISLVYLLGLFLISLDLPKLRAGFMRMFTASAREKVELVLTQLSRAAIGFLRAQFILSLLTFVLAFVGLLLLHVRYPALLALMIVIVDILPILGTGSVLVPWAVYSFLTGDPRLGAGLLVLFAVITVIRRLIEPKILGSSLGISALSALVSMYLGFQLAGFFGLILGPALVIIWQALRKAGFLKWKIDF